MTQKEHEEQKKRLYELVAQSYTSNRSKWEVELFEDFMLQKEIPKLVDDLLDGGVIVPPCKVGDTVYSIGWLNELVKEEKILYLTYNSRLDNFVFVTGVGHFDANQIGKFIFLTREAAERALKEPET